MKPVPVKTGSRYPEDQNGFPRIKYGAGCVKHGVTVKEISDTPQLAAGQFIPEG
jgi:hypothetical protein